jgi:hypothetical protein
MMTAQMQAIATPTPRAVQLRQPAEPGPRPLPGPIAEVLGDTTLSSREQYMMLEALLVHDGLGEFT